MISITQISNFDVCKIVGSVTETTPLRLLYVESHYFHSMYDIPASPAESTCSLLQVPSNSDRSYLLFVGPVKRPDLKNYSGYSRLVSKFG